MIEKTQVRQIRQEEQKNRRRKEEDAVEETLMELDFPLDVSNTDATIEDGELTYALVSDTPFEGTLKPSILFRCS